MHFFSSPWISPKSGKSEPVVRVQFRQRDATQLKLIGYGRRVPKVGPQLQLRPSRCLSVIRPISGTIFPNFGFLAILGKLGFEMREKAPHSPVQ
ncbi:hypothetical protein J3R74_002277 [Puniceicoccus vermicola]